MSYATKSPLRSTLASDFLLLFNPFSLPSAETYQLGQPNTRQERFLCIVSYLDYPTYSFVILFRDGVTNKTRARAGECLRGRVRGRRLSRGFAYFARCAIPEKDNLHKKLLVFCIDGLEWAPYISRITDFGEINANYPLVDIH